MNEQFDKMTTWLSKFDMPLISMCQAQQDQLLGTKSIQQQPKSRVKMRLPEEEYPIFFLNSLYSLEMCM